MYVLRTSNRIPINEHKTHFAVADYAVADCAIVSLDVFLSCGDTLDALLIDVNTSDYVIQVMLF